MNQFTYRDTLGRELEWGELDGNLRTIEAIYTSLSTAMDAVMLHAGTFADTAAGIAGTSNGAYFTVPGAEPVYLALYRNVSGVATLIKNYNNPDNSATAICRDGHYMHWDMTPSGGTAEKPAVMTYAKALERVKVSLTWGTTGGATDNVVSAVFEYSSNGGTGYSAVGTRTTNYDGSGNVSSIAWS